MLLAHGWAGLALVDGLAVGEVNQRALFATWPPLLITAQDDPGRRPAARGDPPARVARIA